MERKRAPILFAWLAKGCRNDKLTGGFFRSLRFASASLLFRQLQFSGFKNSASRARRQFSSFFVFFFVFREIEREKREIFFFLSSLLSFLVSLLPFLFRLFLSKGRAPFFLFFLSFFPSLLSSSVYLLLLFSLFLSFSSS
jgi:hypothetical protein